MIRLCPQCKSERSPSEFYCEGEWNEGRCDWPLTDLPITARDGGESTPEITAPPIPASPQCVNGHSMEPGDQFCILCGADPASQAPVEPEAPVQVTEVEGWRMVSRIPTETEPWERFLVEDSTQGRNGILTLYREGFEPDTAVQDALKRTHKDHIPELLASGRFQERAFEVIEHIQGESLAKAGWLGAKDANLLKRMVDELGRAIAHFSEISLRHRDIRPGTILLRTMDPLDLVITSFGSARLSDFDLDAVAPLELSFYSAPETIVGAVSGASDWWSLGMIVLEQVTSGACFSGINEKAFHLHVVTRGVEIPSELEPGIRLLLRGLLARDPLIRWSWPQVRAWLAGEPVEAPPESAMPQEDQAGRQITLGGKSFQRPEFFALAAAEARNWEEGRNLTLKGAVATWLEERGSDPKLTARIRRISTDEHLAEDFRHALALMVMNPSLPLTVSGEIVTPAWLLSHLVEGYSVVTGRVAWYLDQMKREPWIVRLKTRAIEVRERAKMLEIDLDEERIRPALLTSSRANLEVERDRYRQIYPDTDHAGLSSILERSRLTDEELIILITASTHQFIPLATLMENAEKLAHRNGITLDREWTSAQLIRPRRELLAEIDERTANFARCGLERIDEWADTFRIERRLSLERSMVLLSTAKDLWKEPPRQQYLANLLEFFEKRVSSSVLRGPLTRFAIGKTTPRVDLFQVGTALRPSEALLNHVLGRANSPLLLDPLALNQDENLHARMRRLVSHANMFRRDSGIDGRYLGFPFLTLGSGKFGTPGGKRRLAPVLLWPVVFDMDAATGVGSLQFDGEREEIRINPALEGLLGPVEFAKWKSAREDLLGRQSCFMADVVDAFSGLAAPRSRNLTAVPGPDAKSGSTDPELICCAALFNAEFTGQAISENLRQMRRMPAEGTGIEAVLRVQAGQTFFPPVPKVPERDRFFTVESDPSQESAVLQSRSAPGLLVEGPPGTGKSQTIVNIVADSIGRGESVLIICQKQAALKVVQKRLAAEGLGERLFLVVDVNRDRETIIRSIREQVDTVRASNSRNVTVLKRERDVLATRIETIEAEIDSHHRALHSVDTHTGFSYRSLLGHLIGLESGGSFIEVSRLRPTLVRLRRDEVSRIEEICGPLARLWLASNFEENALHELQQFGVDKPTIESFREDLSNFCDAEAVRSAEFLRPAPPFEITDPRPYQDWLKDHGPAIAILDQSIKQDLAQWSDLFRPIKDEICRGDKQIARLEQAISSLDNVNEKCHDDVIFASISALNSDEIRIWIKDIDFSKGKSFFERLNPQRWFKRRLIRKFLAENRIDPTDDRIVAFRQQLELELELAPIRQAYKDAILELRLPNEQSPLSVKHLKAKIAPLFTRLQPIPAAAHHVYSCPNAVQAEEIVKSASLDGYTRTKGLIESALERYAVKERSRATVGPLDQWFKKEWLVRIRSAIEDGQSTLGNLQDIQDAFGTLEAFQMFRVRVQGLEPIMLSTFAILRGRERELEGIVPERLEREVRGIIQREACLAWKARMEGEHPELLLQQNEITSKVANLADLDVKMRTSNKKLLATDIMPDRIGALSEWEEITRLRGPRMKRLREILDLGAPLGLFHLRPIWLMNPEVASRVLPLKGRFFNVVIYDEASQMPVEHAIPTLFRGSRIVISGDEKQMPPTSFFSSRIDGDEDEEADGDGPDDGATEAEKSAHEESWNRREVKDCPDLLQLARGVIPNTTLQIHYRSKYRELIGFSNHAFYQGKLSVPVRHPDGEILRIKPIEVIRVDGIYENQTNQTEALKVVDLLAAIWAVSPESRPSIGVVTFNRKQADLIEEAIEKRGMDDPGFLLAYQTERERKQAQEDMGFFVKNVENVQGDERDFIIFSTTFGRDKHGAFRRNFGVLGQVGGERRLNVAVTRARERVILVTSMPVADISDMYVSGRSPARPRDFLQSYLDYAQKLSAGNLALARSGASRLSGTSRPISKENIMTDGFADSVADFIRKLGYSPVPANEGDAFGLDFAIENKETGLFGIGIECDSPCHDLLETARAREIWRPKVLSRAIPRVHRISSQSWYQNGDEERKRLHEAILTAVG